MIAAREDDQAQIDAAVACYRDALAGAAELAAPDVDELEDHLRSLIDDLRERGLGAQDAIAEAVRRIGEAQAIAREHARARSPFGATLSRGRAWSSAVLLTPVIMHALIHAASSGGGRMIIELALCAVVSIALGARVSWARPMVIGAIGFLVVPMTIATIRQESHPLWLVWASGTLAFIAPWRRHELSKRGWSLALQLGGVLAALLVAVFPAPDPIVIRQLATLALATSVLGVIGSILRARWAVAAAVPTTIALAVSVTELWVQHLTAGADSFTLARLVTITVFTIAAGTGAVLAWRTTPSRRGPARDELFAG
ncbi:MAG: hypothetical protein AB7P03_16540 [Kofleriaceae bacterium]